MRIVLPLIAAIGTVFPATIHAAAESPNVRPGLWELTTRFSQEPELRQPGVETQQMCLTAEHLQSFSKASKGDEPGCEVLHHAAGRDREEFAARCMKQQYGGKPFEVTISAESDYGGDWMKHREVQQDRRYSFVTKTTLEITARRIGDC